MSAIKILRRDLSNDPIQRDRFLREARAVNRINHENIVEITDYGETEDGLVYLVMEYIAGDSLLARMRSGPIPEIRALDIAMEIASGLGRAHQMGVIHRDLKPDNILLVSAPDNSEHVKILDFGIAKLLDMPSLTASDRIFGTPGYIAPEYASGATLDGRADLYSLGVVLYEMVTGQLPFDAEYQGDLLLKHMLEPPIPPKARKADLSDEVNAVILRSLAKDPAERFRDAFHMIDELRAAKSALAHRSTAATAPTRPSQMPPELRELTEPLPRPGLQVPSEELGTSPGGALAWSTFVDGLRADAEARTPNVPLAAATDTHLARMERLIDAMTERAGHVDSLRTRMLSLETRGRDFRTTMGRAIDTLAKDLSAKARDRDAIAAERDALEARREAWLEQQRLGPVDDAGAGDALLWQIAACNEVLRAAVGECEDLEFQLQQIGQQLERLNESLETDQNSIVVQLSAGLGDIRRLDSDLRSLTASFPKR